MSTITVVRKNGAVAIGADSLWKDGSTMMRASRVLNDSKILRIGDSLIGFTGTDAWAAVLGHYFARLKEPPQLGSASEVFETVLQLHSALKNRYGLNTSSRDHDDFEPSQFCLMIANCNGIFGVYPDRSVTEFATFYAFGSGYRFALGAMHVAYDSAARPEDIARVGVESAAEFDENTGLPAEVVRVELTAREQKSESDATGNGKDHGRRNRRTRAGR